MFRQNSTPEDVTVCCWNCN